MTLTTLAFLTILFTLPVSFIIVKAIDFGYELTQRTKANRSDVIKAE